MISRRNLLGVAVGAGAVVVGGTCAGLVEAGVLPGRGPVRRTLGWDGPDTPLPTKQGGRVVDGEFRSRARGDAMVRWRATYPPGMVETARLPVAVALHGRGGDYEQPFDVLGVDRYLAEVVDAGIQPFVVVSVDGGETYWHRRKNGDDPPEMIRTELLPRLAERGLQTKRVGMVGWSMGGYGALLYAENHPAQVAAVAAVSPALWRRPTEAADGAFDDAADFRRNDVFARKNALRGVQVRVDCGDVDPFVEVAEELRAELRPTPSGEISEGGHNEYYWRRAMPGVLGFLGDALTQGP